MLKTTANFGNDRSFLMKMGWRKVKIVRKGGTERQVPVSDRI